MISPTNGLLAVLIVLSALLGILLVLPVGGADVPIIISLLNAFTGCLWPHPVTSSATCC